MKRLISILTAAVLTFCTAAALPSELRTSADDATQKAFEKIRCTLEDGTIRFSHDIEPNIFAVFTDDEFELSRSDNNDYLFTPAKDGQYVITLFERVGIPEVTFGFYINYYSFLITSQNGSIDLGENERYFIGDPDDSGDSAVLAPVAGEPMPFVAEDRDYIVMLFYLAASQLKDSDHLLMYHMESTYDPIYCDILLLPVRNSDYSVWEEDNGIISPVGLLNSLSFEKSGYPAIPGTVPPCYIQVAGLWLENEDQGRELTAIKCEGDRTTKYSITVTEHGSLDPSSLTIKECPENDINADGAFNVADAVLLSKWLLGDTSPLIVNWRSADISGDGLLNTFDLCFMKDKLLSQN